jgi:poly [ADP-ribose] polymerase
MKIPALAARFEATLGNVQPLWHGTRASNLLSILKNGLIIPPASASQCTGRMFGNGVYFSNQSTKALNYATGYWNRSGSQNQRAFMLLVDVALGCEYRPRTRTSDVGNDKLPKNYDSLWIEPGSCNVINQEAIVYRVSQCNPRYLCEFS